MKHTSYPMGKQNKAFAAPQVLLLNRHEVEELKAVEHAFKLQAEGKAGEVG